MLAEALLSGLPADPELVADDLPAVSALTRPTDRRVQGMASGAQVSLGRGKPGQYIHCGRLERTRALPLAQGGAPGGAGGAQPGRAERDDGSEPAVGPGVRFGGIAAQRRRIGVKSGVDGRLGALRSGGSRDRSVLPAAGLVVGLVAAQTAVQDADEAVAQRPQGGVVSGPASAVGVVVGPGAR